MTIYVEQRIDQFLTPEGLGGPATFNANDDYTDGELGATEFHILVPLDGPNFLISSLTIAIVDSGISMEPAGTSVYAQQVRLPVGIKIQVKDADLNVKHDLLNGGAIQTTAAWIFATTTYRIQDLPKQVTSYNFRWDFLADSGGFSLQLLPGERFSVILNDDFTGLITQAFAVRGIRSTPGGVAADPS